MTGEIMFVFGVLAVTIALFLCDRIRIDIVALLVILALTLSGQLTAAEALAGFGNPVVILIAGLFVVGEALSRTGIANAIGAWLARSAGGNAMGVQIRLMIIIAVLSAFMSSTGAVAIFIPVAFGLSRKFNIAPSRLMMPMAFAALMGGMLTLIGTPPNLIVSEALVEAGHAPFRFHSFTLVGTIILAAGISYLVAIGPKLLISKDVPNLANSKTENQTERNNKELLDTYALSNRVRLAKVLPGADAIGKTLRESGFKAKHGVVVLGLERASNVYSETFSASSDLVLREGDVLLLLVPHETFDVLENFGIEELPWSTGQASYMGNELGLVEVVVSPRSTLRNRTIKDIGFQQRYGLLVLGILRAGKTTVSGTPGATGTHLVRHKLAMGDTLLLGGPWRVIETLKQSNRDVLVLHLSSNWRDAAPAYRKAPQAVVILAALMLLMIFNIVPAVTAVILASVALVLTGCLDMTHVYRCIDWKSIVLIAGMLPMATALEKTGGMTYIVDSLLAGMGSMGPYALMAALFLLTALFSQVISNTATAVLLTPIGIGIASQLKISPEPMVMAIALAASAAFATPVASPVNTLVFSPGGYRFVDFIKVGLPLIALTLIITLLMVPIVFPF